MTDYKFFSKPAEADPKYSIHENDFFFNGFQLIFRKLFTNGMKNFFRKIKKITLSSDFSAEFGGKGL